MQPFRLRKDARDWFKELKDQKVFKIDFEAYYFCFMSGIAEKRKKEVSLDETAELVDHFPAQYKSRGKLLIGLFLKTELEILGVSMDDRQNVRSEIGRLVTPESQSCLSDEGMQEFNKYAHGGYEQLKEWFEERPHSLEDFLRSYKKKIDAKSEK